MKQIEGKDDYKESDEEQESFIKGSNKFGKAMKIERTVPEIDQDKVLSAARKVAGHKEEKPVVKEKAPSFSGKRTSTNAKDI